MQISARSDYAIRAMLEMASSSPTPLRADTIAEAQNIPNKFLDNILLDLKRAKLVVTLRGHAGGYKLARPAEQITVADVIRAVDGPLANVRGLAPEETTYAGAAALMRDVWIALRASMRSVLESVTLADIAKGQLPQAVCSYTSDPESWSQR